MARTSKLPRYREFNMADNAYGPRAQEPKSWLTRLDPELPLNLELGCGKAEVTLALAQKYPNENFIGVDLKADRLWRASKNATGLHLDNVALIQANILTLPEFIRAQTTKLIWLTHPDPFPKDRHAKHRMLNRNFLDIYKQSLEPAGVVRFKSDNRPLYDWALELLNAQPDVRLRRHSADLYAEMKDEDIRIETTYTKKFRALGVPIHFIEFEFIR